MILPIIITIIGLIYIISPIDLIPDVIPVIGWSDDFLVGIIIIGSWILYALLPLISIVLSLSFFIFVIIGLIYIAKFLLKKNSVKPLTDKIKKLKIKKCKNGYKLNKGKCVKK